MLLFSSLHELYINSVASPHNRDIHFLPSLSIDMGKGWFKPGNGSNHLLHYTGASIVCSVVVLWKETVIV